MVITHKIKIDLSTATSSERIDVAQDDKYSRNVEISLYAAGMAWLIPNGACALLRYEKADGKGGSYDSLPDDTSAFTFTGNKITVKLAPQVCNYPGPVRASVTLIVGTVEVNTFPFIINVHRIPGVNAVSEEYINVSGLLRECLENAQPFVVTITGSDADGYTADKTFAEVKAAIDEGRHVFAKYVFDFLSTPNLYRLEMKPIMVVPNAIGFVGYTFSASQMMQWLAELSDSDTVSLSREEISALPSVDESDNGSELRVVDGSWKVQPQVVVTHIANVREGQVITRTITMSDGSTEVSTINLDENDYPVSGTFGDNTWTQSWEGFDDTAVEGGTETEEGADTSENGTEA